MGYLPLAFLHVVEVMGLHPGALKISALKKAKPHSVGSKALQSTHQSEAPTFRTLPRQVLPNFES